MNRDSVEPAAPAGYVVRVAASSGERDRVFRFRFESFASEYGRWPAPALVARKTIRDEVDDRSTIFSVEVEGRVVATLRLRVGNLPAELLGPFEANRFSGAAGSSMALADAILVSRIYRKASVLESMVEAAVARCEEEGVLLLFSHVRPDALVTYQAIGFREVAVPFEHADFGPRVPLVRFLELGKRD